MGFAESAYLLVPREDLLTLAEHATDGTADWLRGEHDASTGDGLEAIMGRAIELDDAGLVIDLSGVEFMGSPTVGVINRARESLRARSRSLTMRSPSRCARRALALYGLPGLLDDHPVEVTPTPAPYSDRTGVAGRAGS